MKLGALFLAALLLFLGYGVYSQLSTKPAPKRLACHEKTTTFERTYGTPQAIKTAQHLLREGAYSIAIKTQPSVYMPSQLFTWVKAPVLTQAFVSAIGTAPSVQPARVGIDCLIYENDKEDPGKKSPKSKRYAGYVVASLLLDNTLLYKIQIDFMDPKGNDIAERVACAVASIMSL